jgi:hypothetical protein
MCGHWKRSAACLIVPDNTKVAVIEACLFDPPINRTYADMASHYGTAVLPARPRRPRDKATVEQGVLIIERLLLGRLRNRIFFSLAEVNTAIAELVKRLNEHRVIRRLGVTRRQLLEELDRPALKPIGRAQNERMAAGVTRSPNSDPAGVDLGPAFQIGYGSAPVGDLSPRIDILSRLPAAHAKAPMIVQ